MKKLCIIGGMGPLASCEFNRRIILSSPAKTDQDHIETLLISDNLMPDRTQAILTGDSKDLLARFKSHFELGEAWGADFFAIPCNTSHYFMDDFKKMTDKKILNMVDLAVHDAGDNICVLATRGTYKTGIYRKAIAETGKNLIELTEAEKDLSMQTIYRIKAGEDAKIENFPEFFAMIQEKLEAGAKILLACTELSLIKFDDPRIIDAMDSLVRAVIDEVY